jgi:hypothetical protein
LYTSGNWSEILVMSELSGYDRRWYGWSKCKSIVYGDFILRFSCVGRGLKGERKGEGYL